MMLLHEVNKFLRATDMKPTRFGREAVKDPRFVFDLRNGREARPKTAERVRAFMAEQAQAVPAVA